jgi:hypothetical protein
MNLLRLAAPTPALLATRRLPGYQPLSPAAAAPARPPARARAFSAPGSGAERTSPCAATDRLPEARNPAPDAAFEPDRRTWRTAQAKADTTRPGKRTREELKADMPRQMVLCGVAAQRGRVPSDVAAYSGGSRTMLLEPDPGRGRRGSRTPMSGGSSPNQSPHTASPRSLRRKARSRLMRPGWRHFGRSIATDCTPAFLGDWLRIPRAGTAHPVCEPHGGGLSWREPR